jgi:hypothetical protein
MRDGETEVPLRLLSAEEKIEELHNIVENQKAKMEMVDKERKEFFENC